MLHGDLLDLRLGQQRFERDEGPQRKKARVHRCRDCNGNGQRENGRGYGAAQRIKQWFEHAVLVHRAPVRDRERRASNALRARRLQETACGEDVGVARVGDGDPVLPGLQTAHDRLHDAELRKPDDPREVAPLADAVDARHAQRDGAQRVRAVVGSPVVGCSDHALCLALRPRVGIAERRQLGIRQVVAGLAERRSVEHRVYAARVDERFDTMPLAGIDHVFGAAHVHGANPLHVEHFAAAHAV
mmetsp:Transcript_41360/g.127849  ORF Transcript_41360/g.127849 Transcript_41360/m.127849 type:complete len:244 (+) Transcript_41360:375-1106(+)